jgi:signal transduction histidine kinase
MGHLDAALAQCTLDLAGSKRALRLAVSQRKAAETALKESKRVSSQLLKESSLAEERLKTAVRKILSENEEDRRNMSLRLHDEIVQTLLGVQVRLLALSKAAASNAGLIEEIATTQSLVTESVRTIKRLAGEFGMRHDG